MIERTNILGVGVSALNMSLAVATVGDWISRRERHYVCVRDVHGVMKSQRDELLRRIHNQAGLVTPDGMPLVWLSRLKGRREVSRVYGPDLLLAICGSSIQRGYRHYFYGGAEGVADRLAQRMQARFPGLLVAGCESPPFHPLSTEEDAEMVARLNAASPDIIWVGLSTPKQEMWMAAHRASLEAPVLIGVGAAFDFHAGIKRQAPHWMQRSGLEWLFRLVNEPGRLWRRYLIYNPWFVWLVFLQLTGLKRFDLDETSKIS